ncbi:hypothetical protein LWI29_023674 [Acer saccharum]|uniref:Uncharacterized protein n=1 Tax=Acer saccharum TaxID=4024 RepID=A0AA39W0B4_ACESA|nr:hypothetical protein LWI29_023674 [Acer saccharum]
MDFTSLDLLLLTMPMVLPGYHALHIIYLPRWRPPKHVSHLVYENGHMRTQLQSAFSCVILLAIAEETLAEFLSKASRTAVDWVQMIEMKTFAPTTFAAARDFWTLRYSTNYEC